MGSGKRWFFTRSECFWLGIEYGDGTLSLGFAWFALIIHVGAARG